MVLISRKQMASVSLGIDIVGPLAATHPRHSYCLPTTTNSRTTGMTFALVIFH